MKRIATLFILVLLTACAFQQDAGSNGNGGRPVPTVAHKLVHHAVCRIGPDGGPAVADRGIGGTGAPRIADRGIGGTGVVGVITGFASICVDGMEVRYDPSAPVDIDGVAASTAALRAGQVVVIRVQGPVREPVARTISVRRDVTGRIEAVELGSGLLTVAGQPVTVPPGTWGADSARLGDWVAVSGLRRQDGVLVASRLDPAPAGALLVRGQIVRDGDSFSVGQLPLRGAAATGLKAGQFVTVSGSYVVGRSQVRAVTADPLFPNPAGYFGPSVNHMLIEAFVRAENGAVWVNGQKLPARPGVHWKDGSAGIAVVSLWRNRDGSFAAGGLRYSAGYGVPPARVSPAPGGPPRPDPAPRHQHRGSGSLISDDSGTASPASGQGASAAQTASAEAEATSSPVLQGSSIVGSAFLGSAPDLAAASLTSADAASSGASARSPVPVAQADSPTDAGATGAEHDSTATVATNRRAGPRLDRIAAVASRTTRLNADRLRDGFSATHRVMVGGSNAAPTISLATSAVTAVTHPDTDLGRVPASVSRTSLARAGHQGIGTSAATRAGTGSDRADKH